jgi:hypothetical protein
MRIVFVGAVLLVLCTPAFAAGEPASAPPAPQAKKGPCLADVDRFCSKVPMGNGRRIACLAKHQKQLTPSCHKALPVIQAMFEFGQEQHRKTQEYLAKQAKQEAAAAKLKAATDGKTAKPPAAQAPNK